MDSWLLHVSTSSKKLLPAASTPDMTETLKMQLNNVMKKAEQQKINHIETNTKWSFGLSYVAARVARPKQSSEVSRKRTRQRKECARQARPERSKETCPLSRTESLWCICLPPASGLRRVGCVLN